MRRILRFLFNNLTYTCLRVNDQIERVALNDELKMHEDM